MATFLGIKVPYTNEGVGVEYDSNFSLLLHGDGLEGSTSLQDSSVHSHIITVNGGAIISQGQSKFGIGSLYSATTPDTFSIVKKTDEFLLGLGDFTLGMWVYPTVSDFGSALLTNRTGPDMDSVWNLGYKTTGGIGLLPTFITDDTIVLESPTAAIINTWNYITVTRQNGTFYLFVNGVLEHTNTIALDFSSNYDLHIGLDRGTNKAAIGYIDEIQLVKDVAFWTTSFSVPITESSAIIQTTTDPSFLCHFNGSNGATSYVDNGVNDLTITSTGTAALSTSVFKLGTASIDCTGPITNHVEIDGPAGNPLYFAANDFTVDIHVKIPTTGSTTGWLITNNIELSSLHGSWSIKYDDSVQRIEVLWQDVSNVTQSTGLIGPVLDTEWHHIAVSRSSTSLYIFVDGILVQTNTIGISQEFGRDSTDTYIGYASCYVDELRIINGTAEWNDNFIAPYLEWTNPIIPIPDPDTYISFETGVVDTSATPHTVTSVGANISNSIFHTGTKSGVLDGVPSTIIIPSHPSLELDNTAFTIEFDVYFPTSGLRHWIMTQNTNTALRFYIYEWSGTMKFFYNNAIVGTHNIVTYNQWQHWAFVHDGTTLNIYRDGIFIDSGALNISSMVTGQDLRLGATLGTVFPLEGYLDNLIIHSDYARYTTNFTPSTSAYVYPGSGPQPSLVLNFDGANDDSVIIDDSIYSHAVNSIGTALSSDQAVSGTTSAYFPGNKVDYIDVSGIVAPGSKLSFEMWIYPTVLANYIFSTAPISIVLLGTGGLNFNLHNGNTGFTSSGSLDELITVNAWNHIAFNRNGSSITAFVNNVKILDIVTGLRGIPASWRIGANAAGEQGFVGYIDEYKAYYTDAIFSDGIPVSSPRINPDYASNAGYLPQYDGLEDVVELINGVPSIPNTTTLVDPLSLFIRAEETEGSTNILDSSSVPHTITPSNGATITNVVSAVGSVGSVDITNGKYISTDVSTDFAFGLRDFTIDFQASVIDYGQEFDETLTAPNTWVIDITPGGNMVWKSNIGHAWGIDLDNVIDVVGTGFKHHAFVRSSGTFKHYIDGVEVSTTTSFGLFDVPAAMIEMGKYGSLYLDEFRFSEEALWTSPFVPPVLLDYTTVGVEASANILESSTLIQDGFKVVTSFTSVQSTEYIPSIAITNGFELTFNNTIMLNNVAVIQSIILTIGPHLTGFIHTNAYQSPEIFAQISPFQGNNIVQFGVISSSITATNMVWIGGVIKSNVTTQSTVTDLKSISSNDRISIQPSTYVISLLTGLFEVAGSKTKQLNVSSSLPALVDVLRFVNASTQSNVVGGTVIVDDGRIEIINVNKQADTYTTSTPVSGAYMFINNTNIIKQSVVTSTSQTTETIVFTNGIQSPIVITSSQLFTINTFNNGLIGSNVVPTTLYVTKIMFMNVLIRPSDPELIDCGSPPPAFNNKIQIWG